MDIASPAQASRFVDRLGWQVSGYRGLEHDQFDTPAATYIVWLDSGGLARGATGLIPATLPSPSS